jgi:hypothetical protein
MISTVAMTVCKPATKCVASSAARTSGTRAATFRQRWRRRSATKFVCGEDPPRPALSRFCLKRTHTHTHTSAHARLDVRSRVLAAAAPQAVNDSLARRNHHGVAAWYSACVAVGVPPCTQLFCLRRRLMPPHHPLTHSRTHARTRWLHD